MIQAVIFDMDGVLINSEPILRVVEGKFFHDLGFSLSTEEHADFVGRTHEYMWETLKEKYGLSESVEDLVKTVVKRYLDCVAKEKKLMPMPGVVDFLEDLKVDGLRLAVATSANRDILDMVMSWLDLGKFFKVRVCADDVVNGKPDPEIFLKAASGLGVEPEFCVVFEDSFNGIKAGKAAGMKVIGYTQFGKNPQDVSGADLIIDDYGKFSGEEVRKL